MHILIEFTGMHAQVHILDAHHDLLPRPNQRRAACVRQLANSGCNEHPSHTCQKIRAVLFFNSRSRRPTALQQATARAAQQHVRACPAVATAPCEQLMRRLGGGDTLCGALQALQVGAQPRCLKLHAKVKAHIGGVVGLIQVCEVLNGGVVLWPVAALHGIGYYQQPPPLQNPRKLLQYNHAEAQQLAAGRTQGCIFEYKCTCLLYTSDAADE